MVTIKFPDVETQDRAVGFLVRRFSGAVLASGEVLVPEEALAALAENNFSFTVIGRTSHEQQMAAVRGHAAPRVQRRKTGS